MVLLFRVLLAEVCVLSMLKEICLVKSLVDWPLLHLKNVKVVAGDGDVYAIAVMRSLCVKLHLSLEAEPHVGARNEKVIHTEANLAKI